MAEIMYDKNNVTFYCTPKCGITIAESLREDYKEVFSSEKPYKFILTRNPLIRVVSFYIQKIVSFKSSTHSNNFTKGRESTSFNDLNGGVNVTNFSFEEFIDLLSTFNPSSLERHLNPQSTGVLNTVFDRVVRLEKIDEDMSKVAGDLNFELPKKIKHLNDSSKDKIDLPDGSYYDNPHKTIDINIENAFSLSASELIDKGIPSNYNHFLNKDIKDKIYKIYQKDFDLFGYKLEEDV